MEQRIEPIVRYARARAGRTSRAAMIASVVFHGAVLALFALAPMLVHREAESLEFVQVQIVPLQALGTPEPPPPAPARREPERPAAPDPEPEAEPRPAKPEPEARAPEPRPRASEPSPASEPGERPADEPPRRQGSAFGVATGTSPFGGSVGVDNPDFVYSYYIDQMLAIIGSHWVRPPVGGGVEATLHFRIGRQGEVTDLELLGPSGHTSFDLAALRAVRQASPLPPLPASYRHDSLGINLIVQ